MTTSPFLPQSVGIIIATVGSRPLNLPAPETVVAYKRPYEISGFGGGGLLSPSLVSAPPVTSVARGYATVLVNSPTMLITDDDGAFRETLGGVFASRGFRTLLAGDGDEALDIVQREPVHLLLTDMHMPRMSGLEIIRFIRDAHLVLPCILISGGIDPDLLREAKSMHAFSVLRKPIRFPEVLGAVEEAMKLTYGWGGDSAFTNDSR